MKIKEIAEDIQNRLLEAGFTIQRYNAYSTNSVYLKLDYGVCNSIRISDHRGKKYLDYRFNVLMSQKEYQKEKRRFTMEFFPPTDLAHLISRVKKNRYEKIERYGEQGYKDLMEKSQAENAGKRGFWEGAYLVTA